MFTTNYISWTTYASFLWNFFRPTSYEFFAFSWLTSSGRVARLLETTTSYDNNKLCYWLITSLSKRQRQGAGRCRRACSCRRWWQRRASRERLPSGRSKHKTVKSTEQNQPWLSEYAVPAQTGLRNEHKSWLYEVSRRPYAWESKWGEIKALDRKGKSPMTSWLHDNNWPSLENRNYLQSNISATKKELVKQGYPLRYSKIEWLTTENFICSSH